MNRLIWNQIKKEKDAVNVKDVLSTSKLNEPEDLIKNSESLNNMFKKQNTTIGLLDL